MRPLALTAFIGLLLTAGCGVANDEYNSPNREAIGLVIILPGIEGESDANHEIRQGLMMCGVDSALPIYNWGRPIPVAGMLLNQMDIIGNRVAGANVASMVVKYQDEHPGKPVFLVGHSGGGGIAVFAAEAMPAGRKIDGLVLLSASISNAYDLTNALEHTKKGILNVYNKDDVAILGAGTTVMGNVDGIRGPAAGLLGFDTPNPNDSAKKKAAYQLLFQYEMGGTETSDDAHFAATRAGFISATVAPWLLANRWPVAQSAIHYRFRGMSIPLARAFEFS